MHRCNTVLQLRLFVLTGDLSAADPSRNHTADFTFTREARSHAIRNSGLVSMITTFDGMRPLDELLWSYGFFSFCRHRHDFCPIICSQVII